MFGLSWVIQNGEKHCLGAKWKLCWRLRMNSLSCSACHLFWLETGEWSKLKLKKVWIAKGLFRFLDGTRKYAFYRMIENVFRLYHRQRIRCVIGCMCFNNNKISFYCICKSMCGFSKSKCFQFLPNVCKYIT